MRIGNPPAAGKFAILPAGGGVAIGNCQRSLVHGLPAEGGAYGDQGLRSYRGRRVLVTGHTGFKGSWLSTWLRMLGAEVVGYSLDPPSTPSHFDICRTRERVTHVTGDVRDAGRLRSAFMQHRPEIVFHLAAQALVQPSYDDPKGTCDINIGGTVNLLEAARYSDFTRAVVIVTSDKCYENREWAWGYRENDPLGGHDVYSASKACAELVTSAFLRSFFSQREGVGIASARAGNVIGGGDWGAYRLLPDCIIALSEGRPIEVRNPEAIRPWQHVLEPLSGYLWLGALLLASPKEFEGAWNFGAPAPASRRVAELADSVVRAWGKGRWLPAPARRQRGELSGPSDPESSGRTGGPSSRRHEAACLRLCSDKAYAKLNWRTTWDFEKSLARTVEWYKAYYDGAGDMHSHTVRQIGEYVSNAASQGLAWAASIRQPADTRKGGRTANRQGAKSHGGGFLARPEEVGVGDLGGSNSRKGPP